MPHQEVNSEGEGLVRLLDLKTFLTDLGLNLKEDGAYWRTNAAYRDGSNPFAMRISKRSGGFTDFVDSKKGTLKDLVELMTGEKLKKLDDYFATRRIYVETHTEKERIMQEKTFDESILKNLFPNYKFYTEPTRPNTRAIDKNVLIDLKSGLAQEGKMYLRFVFPIYNKDGRIHGFQGRDVTGKKEDADKWKKLGYSQKWVYPVFVPNRLGELETLAAIREKKEIIVVESIGDMIALKSAGLHNIVVTFGTAFSDELCAFIISENVSRVVIATNNDFENETKNVGAEFSLQIFSKLATLTGYQKLMIALPSKNDFGEMSDEEIMNWYHNIHKIKLVPMYNKVLEYMRKVYKDGKSSKAFIQAAVAIKDYITYAN